MFTDAQVVVNVLGLLVVVEMGLAVRVVGARVVVDYVTIPI